MVLSIIGNILGDGDERAAGSGNGSDELMGGDLAGSVSDDELMPGTQTADSVGGSSEDDLFDDGGDIDGGDDLLGGDDGQMGDDAVSLDEMGDVGEMGEMGEMNDVSGMDANGGGVSSEVEARVEEMENDVGSLSSTVNTVQSENEKIGDSLEEIEDNIQKLLEVYEMVTQGVNPFVEGDTLSETMDGGAGAAGSGDFGGQSLFDSEDGDDEDEAIDDDIASAEADEFLDESIIDDADDEADDREDELEDDMSMESETDTDSDGDGEDLSFDELKSEYESGEASWEDGEDGADEDAGVDDGTDLEMDDGDEFANDDLGFEDGAEFAGDDGDADADIDADGDAEAGSTETEAVIDDADANDAIGADESDAGTRDAAPAVEPLWDDGGRPYLETIPAEYDTEFVVMDWLEYLVDELGLDGAARTLRFYGSIHWVSPSVESHLQTVLNGFGGGPDIGEPSPHSSLGVDHKRSLWRISQIATPSKKRRPFEVWVDEEGISIQQAMAVADRNRTDAEADHEPEPDRQTETTTGQELTYTESVAADGDGDENSRTHGDDTGADELEFSHDDGPVDPLADSAAGATADRGGGGVSSETGRDEGIESEFSRETDGDEPGVDSEGTNDAQTILIDEAEETDIGIETETDTDADAEPELDEDDDEPSPETVPAHESTQRAELAEPEVPDGGQMIWVDSDVVLSESGAKLCNTRNGSERSGRIESAKPLVVADETTDLDGWQVERIKLLLAPDDVEPTVDGER